MTNLEFIKYLMKQNSKALGFIPITAIEKAFHGKRIFIHSENNERIGYLYFGPVKKGKDVTIHQICIIKNKREMGFGKKLFKQLHKLAIKIGAKGIRLRCADDLPANVFWKSLGFRLFSTVPSSNKKRMINIYYLSLKE